jgi:hypothetical protein
MTKNRLVWWQFSDLHWPNKPSREHVQYVQRLISYIRSPQSSLPRPHFVIFTGDIARSGRLDEYESASTLFFEPFRKIIGDDPPLLFVPGNHDMDRGEALLKAGRAVTSLTTAASIDEFLANDRQRENFADPFRNYQNFVARWAPPGTENVYQWTYDIVVERQRCRILGTNSAWAGFYHATDSAADDRGRLLLSITQTPEPDEEVNYALFAEHHPFDWLMQDACAPAMRSLTRSYQVGMFGHLHSPRDLGLLTTPHSSLLRIPSMLFFGRPHGDDSAEFARGFAVGEIRFESRECRVRYIKYENVHSGEFREHADVYPDGVNAPVAVLQQLRSQAGTAVTSRGTVATPLSAVRSEIDRLQAAANDLYSDLEKSEHTLEVFQRVVDLADLQAPLSAYGNADQLALSYVLAELSIAHDTGGLAIPGAEFRSAMHAKRDMDVLSAIANGIDAADLDALRHLVDHVSLTEPEKIKRAGNLQDRPTARCFCLLWGLAKLAQLLDNPNLLESDPIMSTSVSSRNVIGVAVGGDGNLIFDLATTERKGYHLAAEAQHAVRRYFAELEDLWRRSHLIPPTVRFELRTPNWVGRSLQSHDIRVDPRPITRLLMGRALYGNRRHVWLRELIQNAVDATEMRARSGEVKYSPKVEVTLDDAQHAIVRDNGIGMTYQQIVSQLTVLGRSGWRESSAAEGSLDAPSFFGRFGIGFASVFSAASSLEVRTRTTDARPVDGLAVSFSGPDRPFYTDFNTCDAGTAINLSLTDGMAQAEFRDSIADLFAYLPACVSVSPDVGLPSSLTGYSSLSRYRKHLNGWSIVERSGSARIGQHTVGYKLEVLHHPQPHKRKNPYSERPAFGEFGRTALTFCVDGVRVSYQQGLRPLKPGVRTDDSRQRAARNLHLSGCYLTIDFQRDDAPVMASRNAVDVDEEMQNDLEELVQREMGALLADLVSSAQAKCITDRARHEAGYRALDDALTEQETYGQKRSDFHKISSLAEAAAYAYRELCPALVKSNDGNMDFQLLANIDPQVCSVATTEAVATHAVFSAFVRAARIACWIVVSDKRELTLLELAWPHDTPLRLMGETAQLYEDFQSVLPEIREGKLWQLLRADYALSEGPVFGSSLSLTVAGRKGTVSRDVGFARRRGETSPVERPRIVLNRGHELIRAIESYLVDASEADAERIRQWFDRFCRDVLEENSTRVVNVVLPQLRDELAQITGAQLVQLSTADLRGT